MLKKFFAAALAVCIPLLFIGCGKTDKNTLPEVSATKDSLSADESIDKTKPDKETEGESKEPANESTADFSGSQETEPESTKAVDKPVMIEERFYKSDYNDSLVVTVNIYDNGGWILEWDAGAQYYADYSYDEEKAGEYVSINGYRLTGSGEADMVDGGFAKFMMSDETLTFQYRDSDKIQKFERIRQ